MKSRVVAILAALSAAACSQTPTPSIFTPPPTTPAAPAPAPKPAPTPPASTATATAVVRDLAGRAVGNVSFADSPAGVIIVGDVSGIGLGAHGIHIHEIGKCEAPFTSAGGHFNPTAHKHGFKSASGPHVGDLPNIDTPAAGRLRFEFMLAGTALKGKNGILDGDGAAIVIHGARDDYATDPSGDSGGRIACGVITAK